MTQEERNQLSDLRYKENAEKADEKARKEESEEIGKHAQAIHDAIKLISDKVPQHARERVARAVAAYYETKSPYDYYNR